MTPEQKYSPAAQAVINDYLDRLRERLSGFPPVDREDLLREIGTHIDEAFAAEIGGDEMERLLRVLRRLGEPADVLTERMSPSMVNLGKKKRLPFYIVSGVLVALFGLPLGAGAVGVVIGVLAAILGLVVAYFATAFSLLLSGVLGMVLSAIVMIDPTVIEWINSIFGKDIIHLSFAGNPLNLYLAPQAEAFVAFIFCAALAGLGALMAWGGRYFLRGIIYLFHISWRKTRELFGRRDSKPPKCSSQTASVFP